MRGGGKREKERETSTAADQIELRKFFSNKILIFILFEVLSQYFLF